VTATVREDPWIVELANPELPGRHHSSFNTTFNVLEGLREGIATGNV
jgi:hypothetical protein